MSVHYKFKSSLEYDTVAFDGLHISVGDLKKSIVQQKRLGKHTDFDLQITNAQTKEVYTDPQQLIPKNTSLVVARIPVTSQSKSWDRPSQLLPISSKASEASLDTQRQTDKFAQVADLSSMDASEEDKIIAMMSQSTLDYDPSRYQRIRGANQVGQVPSNYRCYKCQQTGHWIRDCPLFQEPVDVKKATGIPRSFMVQVAGPGVPGAMITQTGHFAVPAIDHEAYKEQKKEKPYQYEPPAEPETPPVPEDLLCNVCKDLLTDAVLIPCCATSYCDECIRNILLESEDHECPDCHEKEILPETLIPNRSLRNSVHNFKNKTGYMKTKSFSETARYQPLIPQMITPSPEPVTSSFSDMPSSEPPVPGEESQVHESLPSLLDLDVAPPCKAEKLTKVDLLQRPDVGAPPPGVTSPSEVNYNKPPPLLTETSYVRDYSQPSPPGCHTEDRPGTPTVDEITCDNERPVHPPPVGFSQPKFFHGPPPGYPPYTEAPRRYKIETVSTVPDREGMHSYNRNLGRDHYGHGAGPPVYNMPVGYHSERPPPGRGNFRYNARGYRSYPPVLPRGHMHNSNQGIVEDPLAAFERLMKEKDDRERNLKRQQLHRGKSYSRSRSRSPKKTKTFSHSRSRSRTPPRARARSRTPSQTPPHQRLWTPPSKAKVRRSKSHSRSISLSRSRSRSFSPGSRIPRNYSPKRAPSVRSRTPTPLMANVRCPRKYDVRVDYDSSASNYGYTLQYGRGRYPRKDYYGDGINRFDDSYGPRYLLRDQRFEGPQPRYDASYKVYDQYDARGPREYSDTDRRRDQRYPYDYTRTEPYAKGYAAECAKEYVKDYMKEYERAKEMYDLAEYERYNRNATYGRHSSPQEKHSQSVLNKDEKEHESGGEKSKGESKDDTKEGDKSESPPTEKKKYKKHRNSMSQDDETVKKTDVNKERKSKDKKKHKKERKRSEDGNSADLETRRKKKKEKRTEKRISSAKLLSDPQASDADSKPATAEADSSDQAAHAGKCQYSDFEGSRVNDKLQDLFREQADCDSAAAVEERLPGRKQTSVQTDVSNAADVVEAVPVPELSKWERDEEDMREVGAEKSEEERPKITSDVLKRAENAIFQKGVGRSVEASMKQERRVVVEDKVVKVEKHWLPSGTTSTITASGSLQITVPSDHDSRSVEIADEPKTRPKLNRSKFHTSSREETPPPRRSVKERLGDVVPDQQQEHKFLKSTVEKLCSRSHSQSHRSSHRHENHSQHLTKRTDGQHKDKKHKHKEHQKRRESEPFISTNTSPSYSVSTLNKLPTEGTENKARRRSLNPIGDSRKSALDEANFEPDYDASSTEDSEDTDGPADNPTIEEPPSKKTKLISEPREKPKSKSSKQKRKKIDTSSSSGCAVVSSSSSSDSSCNSDPKKNKKKRRRKASTSTSNNDTDSTISEQDRRRNKKKKDKKKSSKKKNKKKHH